MIFQRLLLSLFLVTFAFSAAISKKKFIAFEFKIVTTPVNETITDDTTTITPIDATDLNDKRAGTESITLVNEQVRYVLDLAFGSNKQPITLDIDTGSSDTWVIDKDATCDVANCKSKGVFDSATSTTFKNLTIPFHIGYVDGTNSDGYYVTDDVWLPSGDKISQFQFGEVNRTSVNQGLMGIGYKYTVSSTLKYDNFPFALKNQGLINKAAYSMYLSSFDSNMGKVIFGGYDTKKVSGPFPKIPISSTNQVAVPLHNVTLNGVTIPVEDAGTLLDTGFTLTKFKTETFEKIITQLGTWNEKIGKYTWSCNQPKDKYVSYTFDGVVINVPYNTLIWNRYDTTGYNGEGTCGIGIKDGLTKTSLGDTFLRSAYLVYDLDDKTIQIGQANYSTELNIVEIV